ncbi:hypothetical protein BH10PLA2_BH10PLA2_17880 [soil metagenome]
MFAHNICPASWIHRFLLALILTLSAPVGTCTARADTPATTSIMIEVSHTPCLAWTWSKLFSPVERMVGNQAGMIRLGIIALCSALYIIWWRR